MGDLNTEAERRLGALVKAKYHTDFYILYRYPLAVRLAGQAPLLLQYEHHTSLTRVLSETLYCMGSCVERQVLGCKAEPRAVQNMHACGYALLDATRRGNVRCGKRRCGHFTQCQTQPTIDGAIPTMSSFVEKRSSLGRSVCTILLCWQARSLSTSGAVIPSPHSLSVAVDTPFWPRLANANRTSLWFIAAAGCRQCAFM